MHVTVLQFAASRDRADNRAVIADGLSQLTPGESDVVVLPEAAMRDFGSPEEDLRADAEAVDGPFAQLLASEASRLQASVIAGMFERSARNHGAPHSSAPHHSDELPFNTLLLAEPDGTVAPVYRKIHLYDSFGYRESGRTAAGPLTPAVVTIAGTRVGLMTCYDVRFPELARALVDDGAQVLIVPTAWVSGEAKLDHWRTLVKARAIENTVDVIGAAQCGDRYTGHSMVVTANGSVLAEAGTEPEIFTATLSGQDRERARRRNPSLANRRMGR